MASKPIEGEAISTALAVRKGDAPPDAIAIRPPSSSALMPARDDLSLMLSIAKTVVGARGAMVPASIDTPEKAFAVILAGHELGLRPMTALRHMFSVNGVTQPDTQVMMGLVKSRDPRITFDWTEYTDQACSCTMLRPGHPPCTVRYTMEDAKRANQLKNPAWNNYSRDMLAWACAKRCCRLAAPDLLNMAEVDPSIALAIAQAVTEEAGAGPLEAAPTLAVIPAEAYNEGDEPEPPAEEEPEPAAADLELAFGEEE